MKVLESNLIKFNEKLYSKRAELIKRSRELNMTQKQVREAYKGINNVKISEKQVSGMYFDKSI